jgi:hypothetical protein
LVDTGQAPYAAIESGTVFEWTTLGSLVARGDFGGRVEDTLTAVSRERLAAVVDRERLVELDLNQRSSYTYALDAAAGTISAPAASRAGKLFVVTAQGLLLGYHKSGTEALRIMLDPTLGPSSAMPQRTGPPPVIDRAGRFAVVRSALDPALVESDGTLRFVSGAACAEPVSLVPLSAGRLVLACASGDLWIIGEAAA